MNKKQTVSEYQKLFKVKAVIKNVLIVIPLILAQKNFFDKIEIVIGGVLTFSLMSSICYLTNDFTDKDSDKKNPLKKNNEFFLGGGGKGFNLKKIILINFLLILFLFLLSFTKLFGYSLPIYLVLFYLYNFYFKKIKYLDLIILVIFHLLRLMYGIEIFDLGVSLWFVLFFTFLFFILASSKRIIQFNVSQKIKNFQINCYSIKDISFLLKTIFSLIFLNLFIFLLYFFKNEFGLSIYFDGLNTPEITNKSYLIIQFILYLLSILRIYNSVKKNLIDMDIYLYVIKDKYILIFIVFFILNYFLNFMF
jgi:4-hydroxybenzoate polyprenyltransferase